MSRVEWLLHYFTCVAVMIHMEMVNGYLVSAGYVDSAIVGIDCVECVDRANRCRWRHGKWQVVTSCDTFDFHSISQCANNAYKWSVNSRFNPNKWRNVRPALFLYVEKHFGSIFLTFLVTMIPTKRICIDSIQATLLTMGHTNRGAQQTSESVSHWSSGIPRRVIIVIRCRRKTGSL